MSKEGCMISPQLQLEFVIAWLEIAAAAGPQGDHALTLRAVANATKAAKALAVELAE